MGNRQSALVALPFVWGAGYGGLMGSLARVMVLAGVVVVASGCAQQRAVHAPPAELPAEKAAVPRRDVWKEAGDATWNTTKAVVTFPAKLFEGEKRRAPATRPAAVPYEPADAIIIPRGQGEMLPYVPWEAEAGGAAATGPAGR